MANSFKELGLTPDIIKRVKSDENALALAKGMYRMLSKIFHPYKGGSKVQFAIIAEAMAELDDPSLFPEAKKDYLRPRKEKTAQLQAETFAAKAQARKLAKQMVYYIHGVVANGGLPLKGSLIVNKPGRFNTASIDNQRKFSRVYVEEDGLYVQELDYYHQNDEYKTRDEGVYLSEEMIVIVRGHDGKKSADEWKPVGEPYRVDAAIVGSYEMPATFAEKKEAAAIEGLTMSPEDVSEFEFVRLEKLLNALVPQIVPGYELVVALSDGSQSHFSLFGKIHHLIPREDQGSK